LDYFITSPRFFQAAFQADLKATPLALRCAVGADNRTDHPPTAAMQANAYPRQEQTMNIRRGLIKASQDDARRAGERDRLLLEARRARIACRQHSGPAAPARRLARLLFRRATA